MAELGGSYLLPSIVQILKRASALERLPGVDVQAVARLPVFQSGNWKRAIGEFLRWSGTTPEPWGEASVFELMLCHGPSGARAIFEAYRHDRLERAPSFEEAETQLEAVRTIVSMATYWLSMISWDLRAAPRLSAEEFRTRRQAAVPFAAGAWREPGPGRAEPRVSDLVQRFLFEQGEATSGRRTTPPGVPVFPGEAPEPNLWKEAPDGMEKPRPAAAPRPPRFRPRTPRT
ncbi:MAG TPA: hypothetical protein VEG84_00620 [Thermoanaerobaculia bacterium]|nr:hypothetical protein [Thermoanaerobaculia bacterium]